MIRIIKTNRTRQIISSYLSIQLIIATIQPMQLFALTGGPAQPEFNSFTPIGTSDMVNLSSGDFNYNIPIMDVGGYPLNLAYNSGITMDQEASWVGLGWDLSVGQINRQVRGLPDDFDGDEVTYQNNIRDNITVGASLKLHPAAAGQDLGLSLVGLNLGIEYNNYQGLTFKPSVGLSYNISNNNSVDLDLATSSTQGATVSPSLKIGELSKDKDGNNVRKITGNYGLSFNSRQGVTNLTISNDITRSIRSSLSTSFANSSGSFKGGLSASMGTNTLSFVNNSYTPTKRTPYKNQNFAFNTALGTEIFFGEFQGEIYAYASTQKMQDKTTTERVYGYEHTEKASKHNVLDFNRENDRSMSKNTTTLPVPNYTYDVYSINGQGIGGTFRPFRSQVGYVFDKYIKDRSDDVDFGLEVGAGNLVHIAADFKYQPSTSSTGLWTSGNNARSNFIEQTTGNSLGYEKVYFKNIGEMNIDDEATTIYEGMLGGEEPIRLGIEGFILNKKTISGKYFKGAEDIPTTQPTTTFSKVKRTNRIIRKQAIQKLTLDELNKLTANYTPENAPDINANAKAHHTVGVNVIKEDGSRYLYNQPLYNTNKVEATFNLSGRQGDNDCTTGLSTYVPDNDNTTGNEQGKDRFFNKITTPAYAHTYLLSSVLSTDYEDLTNNGPTDDDLGAYTKFSYQKTSNNYQWRVPFETNKATLNQGLYSTQNDQTGNYVYGQKELMYPDKIETKTHVAFFTLANRNDARGVGGENGESGSTSVMRRLQKITLYSKAEAIRGNLLDDNPANDEYVEPIKEAHFEYDYSLCPGVSNNISTNGGKLTLKKVYFTYRDSKMGKHTPYKFTYSEHNPEYDIKGYNMWGYYKPNIGGCGTNGEANTSEFPYVEQNKDDEDINAESWSLVKIDLPSGGDININYESDDYQYVQDRKALQMFKIVGVSPHGNGSDIGSTRLYNSSSSSETKYVYIKVKDSLLTSQSFQQKYIGDLQNNPVYFRFLLNMVNNTSSKYDFITGYFNLDSGAYNVYSAGTENEFHVAIPVETVRMEGGVDGNRQVNPFSKAGWSFARTHLNRLAYSQNGSEDNFTVASVIDDIITQISTITEIFKGPNKYLRDQKCANELIPQKSWIRLQNPDGKKLGGGLRVTKIEMNDNWDAMTSNIDNPVYKMKYGQEYNYNNLDGTSSGVATYEPSGTKENPFVEPFEDHDINRLLAPSEKNYVEGPLGSSFFPSPMVTYSRVEVKNLDRKQFDDDGNVTAEINKHATGKVINEFYTSRDFPTIAKHTVMDNHYNEIGTGALASFFALNIYQDRHLALSQGYTVILNDMNGKQKSQKVFPEGAMGDQDAISMVEYKYHTKDNGELENSLRVYDENGVTSKKTLGVHYDVVNDFRTSKSFTQSYGADINLALVSFVIPPIVTIFNVSNINIAFHKNTMRTAATTKVIYKTGILKEKIAYDLGASVSTKNLVYDALTGEVLLTETTNEFKEDYYNLNYPGYWAYPGMAQSSKNLDIVANFQAVSGDHFALIGNTATNYLFDADEVWLDGFNEKVWITNVGKFGANTFDLMRLNGELLTSSDITSDSLKIMRSGHRNLHTTTMASTTSMKNPLLSAVGTYQNFNTNTLLSTNWETHRVINTSGVKYSDAWPSQCECDLPRITFDTNGNINETEVVINPYLYNIKGDWRAEKSYAYLVGRHNTSGDPNPRNTGFLLEHTPYYRYIAGNWQEQSTDPRWTFASEITEYSPYGAELENRDALGRYSSAQYGYNYRFPLAVSSNAKYEEIGYDSFEDVDSQCEDGHFNFKKHIANYGGVELSREEAHSGRQSIKVTPNNKAVIESRLVSCDSLIIITPED